MFPEFFKQTVETFETKYPLLVGIFVEPWEREKLMDNRDFEHKYITNNAIIKTFIFELEKRFDKETVKKIVEDTVLKLPANLLVSFVTSYLNSDEATKSNPDVVAYYNKNSNLGVGVVYYMEENGIVSNRKYKELPYLLIDNKYKNLRSDEYIYNENGTIVTLDDVYELLTYPERELVNDILQNGNFYLIKEIFDRFDYRLRTIISILYAKGIDSRLINDIVVGNLSAYNVMILICILLDIEKADLAMNNIYKIIEANRLNLLKEIVVYCLIDNLSDVDWDLIKHLSDVEILAKLKSSSLSLGRKED